MSNSKSNLTNQKGITTTLREVTLQLSPPPPPPPPLPPAVVDVDELAAALQKLGFTNISATEVFEVVKEEQAHKHKAQVERGKALLRREPIPL